MNAKNPASAGFFVCAARSAASETLEVQRRSGVPDRAQPGSRVGHWLASTPQVAPIPVSVTCRSIGPKSVRQRLSLPARAG